ncbi:MAG TPA: glycerophosphodiester phosphodiesterase [Acidimicrobiales bacterium]|nr:glycerophosphodiester phosphodiesterase [Acidimicrobiales bacterium]
MLSVIAHRGASARHRENTVEAFVAAAQLGADGVELDVRRTADGALVVHHDAVLPDGRALSNLAVAEIPDWLPLLDVALTACDGLFVNVEIKNAPNETEWDPTEAVAADVARLIVERGLQSRTIVSAFSLATIDAVRAADPSVATGWLTLPGYDQAEALETVARGGHAALHPHHLAVTAGLVEQAHALGLAVHTWTVDDPDRIRELAAADVDSVITNVPDLALAALR